MWQGKSAHPIELHSFFYKEPKGKGNGEDYTVDNGLLFLFDKLLSLD